MGAISIAPKKGESGNNSKLLPLSISKKNHCSKGGKTRKTGKQVKITVCHYRLL